MGQKDDLLAGAKKACARRATPRQPHATSSAPRDPQLAIAGFENAAIAARIPELGQIIAGGQERARTEVGAEYTDDNADQGTQRAVVQSCLRLPRA